VNFEHNDAEGLLTNYSSLGGRPRRGCGKHLVWLVLVALSLSPWAFAVESAAAEPSLDVCSSSFENIDGQLSIFRDPTGLLSVQDVKQKKANFEPHEATRGLGFYSGQIWVRLLVENPHPSNCERWLIVKPAVQEHIALHSAADDGRYQEVSVGGQVPIAQRPVQTGRFAIFPLTLPPASSQEVFLSFRGSDAMIFQVSFWSPGAFFDFVHFNDITRYLMLGSIALVVATGVIGAYLQRRPAFLLGALAWIAALVYQLVRDKYLIYWFPEPAVDDQQLMQLAAVMFIGAQSGFVLAYLPPDFLAKAARKLLQVIMWGSFLAAAIALLVLKPGLYVLHSLVSLVIIVLVLLAAAFRLGRGSWFLLGGVLVYSLWGQTHLLHTLGFLSIPNSLFDLIAPLTISLGSLLSAVAIFSLIVDANAKINSTQQALLQQLSEEQRQLKLAMKESFLANESKSHFLASVSHDLRQPMYAINLYISTLLRQVPQLQSAPEAEDNWKNFREGLNDLEGSAKYLNLMFEALLDLSRLTSGTVTANISYVNIGRLLGQLEADYQQQAAHYGLQFKIRLPQRMENIEVYTDPVFLERILRNLLVNALRYTHKGGVRLAVLTRSSHIEFRVIDTGPGIERSLQDRVFDEFFQVAGSQSSKQLVETDRWRPVAEATPTAVKEAGIGLGLSISARLAEKLNTRIQLKSQVGKGSVFYFRLPMRFVLRPHIQPLPDLHPEPAGAQDLIRDLFIIVIDDDLEIRRSTERLLSAFTGVEVYTAEDAQQALAHLGPRGQVPDLIISDYGLLEGDGLQAIERIRDEFIADIPGFLITGDTSSESMLKLRESGFKVLYKPVTGPQLITAIEEVLLAAKPT
jgi:signal transduction histidine kinase